MAAPLPPHADPLAALDLSIGPPLDSPASYDLYSEVLGSTGRAAAMNQHVKSVEEAMYDSAVRHLPIDDGAVVEGGLERRRIPFDHAGDHVHRQKVLNLPHPTTGNRSPPPDADYWDVRSTTDPAVDPAVDPDSDRSGYLFDLLRAELSGRYQHTVFWKQSKLPHGFYKVAAV